MSELGLWLLAVGITLIIYGMIGVIYELWIRRKVKKELLKNEA